jgi:hypothetical protein
MKPCQLIPNRSFTIESNGLVCMVENETITGIYAVLYIQGVITQAITVNAEAILIRLFRDPEITSRYSMFQ